MTKYQTIPSPNNSGRRSESVLNNFSFCLFTYGHWTISYIGPKQHRTKHITLFRHRKQTEPHPHKLLCFPYRLYQSNLSLSPLALPLSCLSTNKQHQVPNKPTWELAPSDWVISTLIGWGMWFHSAGVICWSSTIIISYQSIAAASA